ncbi:MAG TPA: DUF815 domain-containing protein [Clostridia bacterium]|nr:MAG: hypothetical protein BWY35_00713 [Firmicutes bacterium ADurb.Bin248]HOG00916.1 DUF815 domain-containing protein [Clostridia bacterium]HOS17649.1 DUF815 domain-containing protein [Clostridia bacterium]HPK14787.1 DUF815 domain-containing protein [Clostridia bacterium]
MRDFRECDPAKGAERIAALTSRLTVLRDEPGGPLDILREFALALSLGDTPGAYRVYHDLSRALLGCGARRVSGDLFMDYLLSLVLEREHAFARMAASGRLEAPEQLAMKADLAALGELATLASTDLVRMAQERHRELQLRSRYPKDDISAMSTALWSGSAPRAVQQEQKGNSGHPVFVALPPEQEWLPWHYGEQSFPGEWAADEALEEVYLRLLKSPDWRGACDDLWNLFAAYGSGDFLKTRVFFAKGDSLAPAQSTPWVCPVSYCDAQRLRLTESVIAFMRGETASHALIYGPEGCGKTALALNLAEDLPELRVAVVDDPGHTDVFGLIERLRRQPLRFLLLLDGVDADGYASKVLLCACSRGGLPQNVLLAATSREPGSPGTFPLAIEMKYPRIADFIDIVCELLETQDEPFDRQEVRNLCVDLQVDAREKLTMTAAVAAASRYKALKGR